jgi:hypothetical protein
MNEKHSSTLLIISLLVALAPTGRVAGQVYPGAQEPGCGLVRKSQKE